MANIGQQVAILVDDVYQVVDGERRLAAARMLGWDTVLCLATGTFATMTAHIKMTTLKQAELSLPAEPMRPRDINELSHLLLRFYLDQVTRVARIQTRRARFKSSRDRVTLPRSINDVVADMLGLTPQTVSGIRSIYMLDDTADTRWPKLADQIKQAIREWEETWPNGATASSMRSRLYERIRASGDSDVLVNYVTRAAGSEMMRLKHRPPKDSANLARRQRAFIPKGLVALSGAAAGLRAAGPMSRMISTEELDSWLRQIAEVNINLKEVVKQIKFDLADKRENESETEEKQA